eukprot:CAMPEP_0183297400 /NCGR_PEP_ID=MMETSP0160_2-20130417/4711_1 /TAXON_ID=2839 ORGANISM="Odontella Sinensis, Strain Grunow 1884" /NCGR_SAMPLE_ID=MMETSP0160_2 /ASSEMBLY_ACC=CAM_ASM_000250 /LENGTH=218 /DNA_ID=CAMNT_0025459219 /DNA_START=29 /DNA_END=685 /DNA_ORIENTATION=-
MWKPGSAAPPASTRSGRVPTAPEPSNHAADEKGRKAGIKSAKKNISGAGKKKQLSGATMGMRFMKRKAEAAERGKAVEVKSKAEDENVEWETSKTTEVGGDLDNCKPVPTGESIVLPQVATAADIYGADADIVGRRSFGGFNKAVSDAWNEALEMKKRAGAKSDGDEKISDEELLRRYERVAKGRGGTGNGGKGASVGNLGEKTNKRRDGRGGKRKRN